MLRMRQLSAASRQAALGGFHYLALHRRRAAGAARCFLRWRTARHRHVRWAQVARDLKRLPLGLHEAYRQLNRQANELNARYSLCRAERAALVRLARADDAERRHSDACK